jgi:preprotein translocase subunit SecG
MFVFFIGLLTLIMVLDSTLLIFLVLIQLPKKEAGAGLAFGGAASDALFGAGSGNVLTKITKYAATIFFVLAIVLSVMQRTSHNRSSAQFEEQLNTPISRPTAPAAPQAPAPSAPTTPSTAPILPLPAPTNAPAAPAAQATNAPAAPATPK